MEITEMLIGVIVYVKIIYCTSMSFCNINEYYERVFLHFTFVF